jgi:hypothetical protein
MAYDCPHCQKPINDAIPKSRFDEINEERKGLKIKIDDLEKSGKAAEPLAKRVQDLEVELTTTKIGHTIDMSLRDAKIDNAETRSAIRDAMEWQWGKLPADNRPPLDEAAKSWLTEPDKAPPVVRSLLPKPETQHDAGHGQQGGRPPAQRPTGFQRHTNGIEGSGSNTGYQPGTLRAKRENGSLTQQDIDNAWAAKTGEPATTPTK